jgi:hypothetical protein
MNSLEYLRYYEGRTTHRCDTRLDTGGNWSGLLVVAMEDFESKQFMHRSNSSILLKDDNIQCQGFGGICRCRYTCGFYSIRWTIDRRLFDSNRNWIGWWSRRLKEEIVTLVSWALRPSAENRFNRRSPSTYGIYRSDA